MNKKIWDLYAPIYELAMRADKKVYKGMYERIPKVIEGKVVLKIAKKCRHVYPSHMWNVWEENNRRKYCGIPVEMCKMDYIMSDAGGTSVFVREYALASGGFYCDCGYKKKPYEKVRYPMGW